MAPEVLARFWSALLGGDVSVPLPGWRRVAGRDSGPAITFQPVPEPKHGKARLHFDVAVDDIESARERVVELGGRSLDQRHHYPEGIVAAMADPEGNEFCIVEYLCG